MRSWYFGLVRYEKGRGIEEENGEEQVEEETEEGWKQLNPDVSFLDWVDTAEK